MLAGSCGRLHRQTNKSHQYKNVFLLGISSRSNYLIHFTRGVFRQKTDRLTCVINLLSNNLQFCILIKYVFVSKNVSFSEARPMKIVI